MTDLNGISTGLSPKTGDNFFPKRRCFRCLGRKKLHKIGSAYSMIDTGGELVTCPMCNGEGTIKSLDEIVKIKPKPKMGRPKKQEKDDAKGKESD